MHRLMHGLRHRRACVFCLLALLAAGVVSPALERAPVADYHARRVHLSEKLKGGVAILFAADQSQLDFMPYRQDADFYYLTGWKEPGAALFIQAAAPANGKEPEHVYREALFLPTRNPHRELYTGAKIDASTPGATRLTGVDEVHQLTELPGVLNKLLGKDTPEPLPVWGEPELEKSKALLGWVGTTLGTDRLPPLADISPLTTELRAVKDASELTLLEKASDASVAAQLALIRAVRPGVSERAVAGVLLAKLLAEGCERPSYAPIVGSGANSTSLHYAENSAVMDVGDVVVVDAAGEFSMYASDITRTLPVNGRFSARQRQVYNIVLGAQRAAIEAFVAGQSRINDRRHKYSDSLDTVALNYMNAHGKDLQGQPIGKYFIHGIGHMVGIDVHDPWDYSKPIDRGMVFTIEPGIYLPEEKLGVRIEDVFYVNKDGKLIDLTEKLPKSAEDIERIMAR
jgi:Xaa-Pro aminopeptidase